MKAVKIALIERTDTKHYVERMLDRNDILYPRYSSINDILLVEYGNRPSNFVIRPVLPQFISFKMCNGIVVQVPDAPAQTNEIQQESNKEEGTGQRVPEEFDTKVADKKVTH